MGTQTKKSQEYYTIDLLHVVKTVWSRAWMVVIVAILAAAIGFSLAAFAITPQFSSSVMLYVNNNSFSLGNTSFSISSSEISAAQSLAKTYMVILDNRTTLQKVIEKTNVRYNWHQLSDMIDYKSVNDTEVLKITVTSHDPYEATKLVNAIGEILPERISEIIDGASMEIVDSGVVSSTKVYPSITKFTIIGFILGAFFSILVLAIFAIMDDTITDIEYVTQNYDIPILSQIPNLSDGDTGKYAYYKSSSSENTASENEVSRDE